MPDAKRDWILAESKRKTFSIQYPLLSNEQSGGFQSLDQMLKCWVRRQVVMDEGDIERLFLSVLEHASQDNDQVREVFATLIKSTLRYRDHMLESRGTVVTVEDVRTALGWLVPSLATGQLPKTDNKLQLDLLKIWLDELKCLGKPNRYLT
jgi:hypothetical protein